MKEWIPTSKIEPADLKEIGTVSGKFGATVMFVAFSSVTGWHWIFGGGTEKISEPPEIFLDPHWAKLHPRRSPLAVQPEKPRIRKRKSEQLVMNL